MELQKINVKVFTAEPNKVPLTDFIDVFHGWIQATDGVYLDVADYSHMQAGPGIVLVADDANVSIDETDNRRGLLYSQKSKLGGSNLEKLSAVLRSALENCQRLEQEPALRGKLRFAGNQVEILVNDRLVARNTEETFDEIRPEIDFLARRLYSTTNFTLRWNQQDPRHRFNVTISTPLSFETKTLLSNLRAI
ncbi:MAG TPA: hypothetical protein VLJ79_29640 [Candidatus Binatia bacterium]|nr:hypothetical protein [Candidatus Binatia bacterium]